MTKLSKQEFARLVSEMPGASQEEILAEARRRETTTPDDRSMVGKTADTIVPLALRLAGAVGGGMAGAVAGLPGVVAGGGAGAGLGETAAQGYEKWRGLRGEMNPTQVATQGALGAIPIVGKAGQLGKTMLSRGGQGAALGGGAAIATELAEGNTPTLGGTALAAGLGGVMGGGMGAMESKLLARKAGQLGSVADDLPPPPPDAPLPSKGPGVTADTLPEVPRARQMAGAPAEFHAVEDAWTNPQRFMDPQKSPLVDGSDYAIVSWANPGMELTAAENATLMKGLEAELTKRGHKPIAQRGVFGAEEPSFLIPGMSADEAKEIGRMGKAPQVSVISAKGYHRLADDATFPTRGVEFDQKVDNYFSEIELPGHGKVKYQLGVPEEAFEAPAAISQSLEGVPAGASASRSAESAPLQPSTAGQGTKALAIAAPAASPLIGEDSLIDLGSEEANAYGRLGLNLLGAAGLGAAVRGRGAPELSDMMQAVHKGAAALWIGGKNAWKQAVQEYASPTSLAASQKILNRQLQAAVNELPNTKKLLAMIRHGGADATWYDKTGEELRKMFGQDAEMVARLIAATSNNATVSANASLAMKALYQHKAGLPFTGFMKTLIPNIEKAVKGDIMGRKVDNFVKAMMGDESAVVVDKWMMRAFGYKGQAPTDAQYEFIEHAVKQLAQREGITPRQAQAAIWFAMKNAAEKGKNRPASPPMEVALKESIERRHADALKENRRFDKARAQPNLY